MKLRKANNRVTERNSNSNQYLHWTSRKYTSGESNKMMMRGKKWIKKKKNLKKKAMFELNSKSIFIMVQKFKAKFQK